MYGVDLLVKEHENILDFTEYLKKLCCDIIDGENVNVQEFHQCIEFARNYADKHHHGKEEQILFRVMLETSDPVAEKLIRNGMLAEHDLGRYHIMELEAALSQYSDNQTTKGKLSIITHAGGYADLLQRHIEKENSACYSYALRMLSKGDKSQIDQRTRSFEKQAEQDGVQREYLGWLDERRHRFPFIGCFAQEPGGHAPVHHPDEDTDSPVQ